jgi:uncharacterized protein
MKLRNKTLLPIILIVMMIFGAVTAYAVTPKIYDKAKLFSAAELEALENDANALSESLQLDIVVVTTDKNEGKTSRAYADDFYDQNSFGYGPDKDGVLLLINMEDREVYISTCGKGIRYLTDARIDSVLDKIYIDLGNGNYSTAVTGFMKEVEAYVAAGIPQDQYNQPEGTPPGGTGYDPYNPDYNVTSPKQKMTMGQKIMIYLAISVAIGSISVGIMAANNKGVSTTNRSTYLRGSGLNIFDRQDLHVNTNTTFEIIHRNPPPSSSRGGGSRSTTHVSSSGRTHGGGGRKF